MIACAGAEHLDRSHTSALTLAALSRMPISKVMELYPGSSPMHPPLELDAE